jgi:hypothetical protein
MQTAIDPRNQQRAHLGEGSSKRCLRKRWREGSERWVCSVPSPVGGEQTTTLTSNPCSPGRRITLMNRATVHQRGKACQGSQQLWIETTISTNIAILHSRHPIRAKAGLWINKPVGKIESWRYRNVNACRWFKKDRWTACGSAPRHGQQTIHQSPANQGTMTL